MDRKQFWILICIINIVYGSAVDYLAAKALEGSGCTINVNGDLSAYQPLIIRPGTSSFVYPADKTGIIHLELGEEVEIACTDMFKIPDGAGQNAMAKCVDGNKFQVNGVDYNFLDFACVKIPYHIARKTGTSCFNNAAQVEIGFDLGMRFLKVLEVCHDEVSEETYFAKYQLMPGSAGFQTSFPRPTFMVGTFFGKKDVDKLYSRVTQRETIAGLVGSFELASKYIEETSDIYLARGHLAAKADFIYGSQQRATFYFVNTAPQWQRFNAQNWEAVEDGTRKLASARNILVDVYTGTFGVIKLDDYFGSSKEIFLYVNGADRKIPTPKLYYKVLINKSDSSGIVFIGVNNPHLTLEEIKKDYVICTDVSDKIDYINWKRDDIGRGFSYACDVNEFMKVVPHFSVMDVKNLLI